MLCEYASPNPHYCHLLCRLSSDSVYTLRVIEVYVEFVRSRLCIYVCVWLTVHVHLRAGVTVRVPDVAQDLFLLSIAASEPMGSYAQMGWYDVWSPCKP